MKKLFSIFVVACVVPLASWGAVSSKTSSSGIKKANPVSAKQQTNKVESMTSMLPAVMGLVGSVQSLKSEQQKFGQDCAPTSDEVSTVNELVKEWAKVELGDASSAVSGLGEPCSGDSEDNSSGKYSAFMEYAEKNATCYESYTSSSDKDTAWYKFPKASMGKKCDADNKKCDTISNIYDVFAKITAVFSEDADFTVAELSKINKLKEKAERCAPGKIAAAKSEAYTGFVTQALGNVGQTTGASGTESVMQAVSALGGSGNLKSIVPSLGQMAMQSLDK